MRETWRDTEKAEEDIVHNIHTQTFRLRWPPPLNLESTSPSGECPQLVYQHYHFISPEEVLRKMHQSHLLKSSYYFIKIIWLHHPHHGNFSSSSPQSLSPGHWELLWWYNLGDNHSRACWHHGNHPAVPEDGQPGWVRPLASNACSCLSPGTIQEWWLVAFWLWRCFCFIFILAWCRLSKSGAEQFAKPFCTIVFSW